MKYMLLIHHIDSPRPGNDAWEALTEEEQGRIYAEWQALTAIPGVTPGMRLQPAETATTVRIENGETLTTDGPFVAVKEAVGGYLVLEADDLDTAIEVASTIPTARLGGAIEVRPILE